MPTQWLQNVAAPDSHRENNRENIKTEKTDRENQETWDKALEQLRTELSWEESGAAGRLTGTTLIEVTETAATIFVPNPNAVAWLERRLYGQIAKAIKAVIGKDVDLQFIACS